MAIRVTIHGDEELIRRFGNTPARMRMLHAAMDAHTGLIWGAVVPLTPVGVTSALRGAWGTEVRLLGETLIGIVGNPLVHSEVIERGRRPGAPPPPVEAIRTWVERKMGAEVSAFVVARSIGRKGIEGRRMLQKAVLLVEPGARALWGATVSRLLEGS